MLPKLVSNIIAGLITLWMPIVLVLNPGWGSFLLVMPSIYWVINLLPLLIIAFNRGIKNNVLPKLESWLQVAFYASWFLMGLCFVSGADTEESVGSFMTRLFGGFFEHRAILSVSDSVAITMFWTSLILIGAIAFVFVWRKS